MSFTVWILPVILGAFATGSLLSRRKAPVSFLGLIAPVICCQAIFNFFEQPWIRALALAAALAAYLLQIRAAGARGAPSS